MGALCKGTCLALWEKHHTNATILANISPFFKGTQKFSMDQMPALHLLLHVQQGCYLGYTRHWGTGRHPSLKEALPFSMFTTPKPFERHHDGFGEPGNTFGVGYLQFQDGQSVPLPSGTKWESPVSVLDTLTESAWFSENLWVLIYFAKFLVPHRPHYRPHFSEKNLVITMARCFSVGLCTFLPHQAPGKGTPHIQKLCVYHQQW